MNLDASPLPLTPGDAVILAASEPSGWAASLPRRAWVVVECSCALCLNGSHVALDVPHSAAMLEMYPEGGLWRHVAARALRRRGELSRRLAEAWGDLLAMGSGPGQGFAREAANGRGSSSYTLLHEFAALALADALGGLDLTEAQAHMLDRWRAQRGGDPL